MKNAIRDSFVLLAVFILMSYAVYAAGSSTGGSISYGSSSGNAGSGNTSSGNGSTKTYNWVSPTTTNGTTLDCEAYNSVKGRVECRLLYGESQYSIPEPCRGLIDQQACTKLYNDVTPCYKLDGTDKDQCLKQTAGFTAKNAAYEKNSSAIRNYILFLLYDIQDRVENAYANQKIDASRAADVIASVVDAKYTITKGQSSKDIKDSVDTVKQKYIAVLQ